MDQNNEMKDLETIETVTEEPVIPTPTSEQPDAVPPVQEPTPVEPASEPVQAPIQPTQNVTFATQTINIPEEYKPLSMWAYFGYELLFAIPCIGFIVLCVFALGGTKNINLKNFARSYFCGIIIGLIIGVIVFLIMTVLGVGLSSYVKYN